METFNNPHTNGPPPDNNLVWAILTTVLCCMPLGVISIIKAAKVKELWALGDTVGAQKAANDAKKWAIWAAIIGPVLYIFVWVLYFVIFASATAFGNY